MHAQALLTRVLNDLQSTSSQDKTEPSQEAAAEAVLPAAAKTHVIATPLPLA